MNLNIEVINKLFANTKKTYNNTQKRKNESFKDEICINFSDGLSEKAKKEKICFDIFCFCL